MSVFTVLEKLAPHVEREVNLILNSKQEAETLKDKLKKIQDGLQDAERKSVSDINVKRWLEELEDVMYQMDDALDKWETKNLELQIEQSEYDDISDPWEKVRSLFMSLCLSFKRLVGRRELTQEMKDLSERLDKILAERGKYNFVSNESDNAGKVKKPETTSPVDESKVYGRKSDKKSLVELLLSKGDQSGFEVVSIVGVGGLGKTTLAQLVFNDPSVKKHFGDLKAWVSVPDPFDASQVAKAIFESFDKSSNSSTTLENLGQRIKAAVSNQNFLLVLDDVWTVDGTEWESLKNFLFDEPGCKILVTTRNEISARTIGTTQWRRLKLLTDSDCATILSMIALEGRSEGEHEIFRAIGFEIAKKCNGLPLAARTIGSMLALKSNVEDWQDVLDSPLWKYEDEMSKTFRALRLSYMDLSPILKRCFLSCVLCPKGSEFDGAELSSIWMAQGYISSSATWDEVHLKGRQYMEKLFMRSFFQEMRRNQGDMKYKMHDVMHEFANYLARGEYHFILDGRTDKRPHSVPDSNTMARIRNFGARGVSEGNLLTNVFSLLKCVRVLCLSECNLEEISQEIGKLIHLRYLDLSWNPIKELPETLSDLYNLQKLNLERCRNLARLPFGIGKLMNLRHLLLYETYELGEYPEGLEKLTGLWTLDEFTATRDSVGYLGNLNQLRGFLEITVTDLNEAAEAKKANLKNKNHIKELLLLFYEDVSNMDVIEAMVPPPQLEALNIQGYGNQQLPSWITPTSFNNLKELRISGFSDCSDLPPTIGKLPMLEKLELVLMKFKRVSLEFMGIISRGTSAVAVGTVGFPKLKRLVFNYCQSWEEWEDLEEEDATTVDSVPINIMPLPCLQELVLYNCSKLKALPHSLLCVAKSLRKLTIAYSECLESRYHKEFGADRDKMPSHIPYINIYGLKTREMNR